MLTTHSHSPRPPKCGCLERCIALASPGFHELERGAGLSDGNSIFLGTLKKGVQTWDSDHLRGL